MTFVRLAIGIAAVLWLWPVNLRAQSEALSEAYSRSIELHEAGQYEEAIPFLRQAVELSGREFGRYDLLTAMLLNNLAVLYKAVDRHVEAEPLYERALKIIEKVLGPGHPDFARTLNNLADLYRDTGRHAKAEPLYERALAIAEEVLAPGHPDVASYLYNLALLYRLTGRYTEAEPLYKRALAIRETVLGPGHPDIATYLNYLAELYRDTGRYTEAEPLYERALAIREAAPGPDTAAYLNNLALLYRLTGRYAEAEPLYTRALAISEAALGPGHPDIAPYLNNLAELYRETGRYAEAEPLYKRALAIAEKAPGPGHPDFALTLNNVAGLYRDTGRHAEAEPLYERALTIAEKALGPGHPKIATYLDNLALLYRLTGRDAEAEPLYERALTILEKAMPPGRPDLAQVLNNLADLYWNRGRHLEALGHIRRASAIYRSRVAQSNAARTMAGQAELRDVQYLFWNHAGMAAWYAEERPDQRVALTGEAFEVAQLATATATATAVSRMAARFAAGSHALARVVRQQQNLIDQWRVYSAALIEGLSRPSEKRPRDVEERLRRELNDVTIHLDELDARIAREFPKYAELVSPEPLAVKRVQQLLRYDEALVTFLISTERSYALVVRADRMEMRKLPVRGVEVADAVGDLRLGLDPTGGRGVPRLQDAAEALRGAERPRDGRSVVALFDVDRAYDLYRKVWAPLEPDLEGVHHVIVVPEGPLKSLPLQVLVTTKPADELDAREQFREVSWLAKRPYSLSVLPAVSSLRALRELAPTTPTGEGFLGFGDPLIGEAPAAECRERALERVASTELPAEEDGRSRRGLDVGLADLFRGGGWKDGVAVADVEAVRRLKRLPDSRCELQALARSLGAGEEALHLDLAATETEVKRLSAASELARAGVLAFATHGLVAGELKGLAEPALVLTPPAAGSAEDDGLLTASEVAGLELNADWVLLSACNTAAADGTPGAEGLSGLARAFFYAGARALLVSHWAVYSDAAVRLTTGTLERLRAEPGLGRAEALRRTMVAQIMDGPNPHPSYWAPFALIGEGGVAVR